ncbi:NADH-quinone oxidoreductase subunit M [Pontibacter sp. E15-1]|uniref:NADH-quinone oxidoreductase subunit M n=1 Tax=Pontibacter sp. E15-1 TaxID=2919918 RepID=UPI001F4F6E50|nr:NADH-quinone oxidoreductase subunit M [Pontibacter sp. E15-1]MCJ8164337.1 NADH-quinone oxidoreductase subunit M [Pontibacter sp. E15-1]
MILLWMIVLLMAGGLLAWLSKKWHPVLPRWIALFALLTDLALAVWIWLSTPAATLGTSPWLIRLEIPWIPQWGVGFSMALDGLSLLMLMLTFFLGILAVLISWREITTKTGFFHFNLLWVLAGITGVFLTMDLFLFYFFWEVMLIPMYFLIGVWGHANRNYAAYKFFIFTQASGLLMLLSILGLYFIHGSQTGTYTFNYFELLNTPLAPLAARLLMFGFLAAFLVKLPVVPFHSWLPDAHSEAPTAGSVILAGLLLKTGAYGLLRFVLPLFPTAAVEFAPWAMLLGVVGIIYGAILAFSQTDLKRLVAYTSVSHMGFVILGVFAFNEWALQGVVMQMIAHGLSTGALFIIAGFLYERLHTRDIRQMGGFWAKAPKMGVIALVFVMASLGLPGLGNFIAEFLTLVGSWQANNWLTVFATTGLVLATVYSLRIMQKVFYESAPTDRPFPDLNTREMLIAVPMVVMILWLGLYPQPVLDTARPALIKQLEAYTPLPEQQIEVALNVIPVDSNFTKAMVWPSTSNSQKSPLGIGALDKEGGRGMKGRQENMKAYPQNTYPQNTLLTDVNIPLTPFKGGLKTSKGDLKMIRKIKPRP